MPTLFEIQAITRQFFRVESEMSVLKAMVRHLVLGDPPPVAEPPEPVERQPMQKGDQIEEGSPLQRIAALERAAAAHTQHFDGRRWAPGPTPENVEGLDVPPGQG